MQLPSYLISGTPHLTRISIRRIGVGDTFQSYVTYKCSYYTLLPLIIINSFPQLYQIFVLHLRVKYLTKRINTLKETHGLDDMCASDNVPRAEVHARSPRVPTPHQHSALVDLCCRKMLFNVYEIEYRFPQRLSATYNLILLYWVQMHRWIT